MMRHTCRTVVVFFLSLILTIGPSGSLAFAWSNGPSAGGVTGNGYGTHDWVLDEAIRLAAADAAWLNRSTALLHTDDPDTLTRDHKNHIYNTTRTGQGGPQTVANYYYSALVAYRAGDVARASRLVGELSHYYSDLCNPYHTARNDQSASLEAEHIRYERGVDKAHRYPGAARSWITPVARVRVFDVRSRAISAALAASKDYKPLRAAMKKKGYSSSASSVTGKISRRRLSRAANDLADIIASIPAASGIAATTRVASVKPSQSRPRQAANVAVHVKVLNEAGRPRRAVRVSYTWKLGSRTFRTTSYTNSKGVATSWHAVRPAPRGKKSVISVSSTTNGVTTTGSTSITPR